MNNEVYIFGHKNPDTDSICSSIAYAYLKTKLGLNVKPYRLGEISKETQYVLNYFNTPTPDFLNDTKPQVKDLKMYHPKPIDKNAPINNVWDMVRSQGSRLIPVTDTENRLEGIVSLGDITKLYMAHSDEDIIKKYPVRFKNLLEVLQGEIVHGCYNHEYIYGTIFLASTSDEKDDYDDKDIVIAGNLERYYKFAFETNCGCVILTNGIEPIISDRSKCCVIKTDYTIFRVVNLLNQCVSVGSVMQKDNIDSILLDDYLSETTELMKQSSHRNFPVTDDQGVFKGIISRRHLIDVNRKEVILIDHNEKSQSVEGLDDAKILEIIDHHRIADIQTTHPLYIRSEPSGSTATIVYKLFKENNIVPPKNIAGLLLGAILSDTLVFTSPTCTEEDQITAEELAVIADVSIMEFSAEMFKAGTDLSGYSIAEILNLDRKEFSVDKFKVSISQVNTMNLSDIVDNTDDYLNGLTLLAERKGYDITILMATDLLLCGSEIIIAGKYKDIAMKAFDIDKNNKTIFLEGVVSRKKQVLPKLISTAQY